MPPTQVRAARSLGFSAFEAFRLIVLPQMFRVVFHPMTNQMVWAILMTSLGVVVGLNTDLTGVTQDLNVLTFRTFEYFAIAAVLYYLIAKVVTLWRASSAGACSGTEATAMFETALTLNDLLFLLAGRRLDAADHAIAVLGGTVLGVIFGVFRAVAPWWASICRWASCSTCSARCRC